MQRRVFANAGAAFTIVLVAGCAGNIRANGQNALKEAPSSASSRFAGRLSLVLEPVPDRQSAGQSFSGGFELRGNATQGELEFSAPTGQILMQLRWTPDGATLIRGQERLLYPSAQTLLEQATGASLSLDQLFAWLNGKSDAQAAGVWQVDLSGHSRGRIVARRQAPSPAELRIVLEQP